MTKTPQSRSVLREYAEAILIAALFLRFANAFVVQTFYIPSSSMEETLLVGDHLFVNRFIYGPEPGPLAFLLPARPVGRGDIVVFRSKEDPATDVVKRCIAVAGDEVRVVDKQLFLNGQAVDDSAYTLHRDPVTYRDLPAYPEQLRKRDNLGPLVVPPGHYFCLGDNRDNSHDSRFWGPLPAHLIKGRAGVIYWSYGGEMADAGHRGPVDRVVQVGRTAAGFFTRTRWGRTFRLVR